MDRKLRAKSRLRVYRYRPVVLFYYCLANGKSQSRTSGTAGVKRLEYLVNLVGGNMAVRVVYGYDHHRLSASVTRAGSGNPDAAINGFSFDRVADHV